MRLNRLPFIFSIILLLCLPPALQAQALDNASCLSCHNTKISPEKFAQGVHRNLSCVSCHSNIVDLNSTHQKTAATAPNCVSCHQNLWEKAKQQNLSQQKAQLGVVVANIEAYKNSFHARLNKDDKTKVNATCDNCHDTHTFNIPSKNSPAHDEWRKSIPNVCGESCHSYELEEYASSIHGKQLLEQGNMGAAICTDCHTTHRIANTSKEGFKTSITENCGSCHSENLESYRATYHGQINKLGYGYTAKCYDCHGSHDILSPSDKESRVHPDNRLKTCQKCHKEATKGFVTFSPHANTHDFASYPQVWVMSRFMWTLLGLVFAFFWLHTGLWWYREAKDRQARLNHPERRKESK